MEEKLLIYINQELRKGISSEAIRSSLEGVGWDDEAIDEAFDASIEPLDGARFSGMGDEIENSDKEEPPATGMKLKTEDKESMMVDIGPDEAVLKRSERVKISLNFKKIFGTVLGLMGLTLLVWAGVLGYSIYFTDGQKMLEKMVDNLASDKTQEYEVKVKMSANKRDINNIFPLPLLDNSTSTQEVSNLNIDLKVKSDINDIANPATEFNLSAANDDILKGNDLKVRAVSAGKSSYIIANNLPELTFDKKLVEGQWFTMGQNYFDGALTEGKMRTIAELFKQYKVFKINKNGVNDQSGDYYHYGFDFNQEAAKQFMIKAYEVIGRNIMSAEGDMVLGVIDRSSVANGEIWITKKDKRFSKMLFDMMIVDKDTGVKFDFIVLISAKSFNQPVNIVAPESAKTLEGAIGAEIKQNGVEITEIVPVVDSNLSAKNSIADTGITKFGSVASETAEADKAKARDEQRKSDLRQLMEAQKVWYGQDNKYYTCGSRGGDCGGKLYGWPIQIGELKTASDPLAASLKGRKLACGMSYVYCGLTNISYSQNFCYYAKLEAGGFYLVSEAGESMRKIAPKIFEECVPQ